MTRRRPRLQAPSAIAAAVGSAAAAPASTRRVAVVESLATAPKPRTDAHVERRQGPRAQPASSPSGPSDATASSRRRDKLIAALRKLHPMD